MPASVAKYNTRGSGCPDDYDHDENEDAEHGGRRARKKGGAWKGADADGSNYTLNSGGYREARSLPPVPLSWCLRATRRRRGPLRAFNGCGEASLGRTEGPQR